MRRLREMIQILTWVGVKKSRLFENQGRGNESTNFEQLYDGITSGRFSNDRAAARHIYQSEVPDNRYAVLKSRFKEILLQSLMSVEIRQPKFGAVTEAMHQCGRNVVCARLLVALGARMSAISLIKRTLVKAQKFDLTDVVFQCARLARRHYSLSGDRTEFEQSSSLLQEALLTLEAETKAEGLYDFIALEYSKSKSYKPELLALVETYCKEIDSLRSTFKTRLLNFTYFRVKALLKQLARDYEGVLEVCNEQEAYFLKHPHFYNKARLAENAIWKLVSYTYLRDYDNGRVFADEWLHHFVVGQPNWFLFQEYYFLLSMHTDNYHKAVEIFTTIVSHRRFEYANPQTIERWKILEAYLRYILTNHPDEQISEKLTAFGRRFYLYKFLNEVPIFSKDKSGFYVPILIVHILFLLDNNDLNGILDRAETIRQYTSRYLRKEEYYRTNCFLRMLRIMIEKDFDYSKTEARARPYYTRLVAPQTDFRNVLEVTEVIPFEVLWKLVLARLSQLQPSKESTNRAIV